MGAGIDQSRDSGQDDKNKKSRTDGDKTTSISVSSMSLPNLKQCREINKSNPIEALLLKEKPDDSQQDRSRQGNNTEKIMSNGRRFCKTINKTGG